MNLEVWRSYGNLYLIAMYLFSRIKYFEYFADVYATLIIFVYFEYATQ